MSFYIKVLRELVSDGRLDPNASTLVVAGGDQDRDALLEVGFRQVTISNLDQRMGEHAYGEYKWAYQDAEDLNYANGEFDQVIVHAGLHHCASPHRALLEMYRVARRAAVVFEARDSLAMRTALKLGLTANHEIEAVVGDRFLYGGVRGSAVPNFVYRWKEAEFRKTLASYDPTGPIPIKFFYGFRFPTRRLSMYGNAAQKLAIPIASFLGTVLSRLLPHQGNDFGVWIGKPEEAFPWLNSARDGIDRDWAAIHYPGQ